MKIVEIDENVNNRLDVIKQHGLDNYGTPIITYAFANGKISVVAQGNQLNPKQGYSFVKIYNKFDASRNGAWNFSLEYMDIMAEIVEDIRKTNSSLQID
jgi:hypothetical protein